MQMWMNKAKAIGARRFSQHFFPDSWIPLKSLVKKKMGPSFNTYKVLPSRSKGTENLLHGPNQVALSYNNQ